MKNALFAKSLAMGLMMALLQGILLGLGNSRVLMGRLIDPDCYMHLDRALAMIRDGRWHEALDTAINAPFGFFLHWTALFDALLVAGAKPLIAAGMGAHQALYLWGSLISPILAVAGFGLLAWGLRERLSPKGAVGLILLFFMQPEAFAYFLTGRPDHHSLVLGILLAETGFLFALFEARAGWRAALIFGALAGLQLATSVEALLTILFVAATILSAWVVTGKKLLIPLTLWLAALWLTAFLWLVWENNAHLFHPVYDRISGAHLVALGSGVFVLKALVAGEARLTDWRRRSLAAALAGVAAMGLTALVVPDFFLGPWPHLDPVIIAWHRQITELAPLYPTSANNLARIFAQITLPVAGFVFAVFTWRRDRVLGLITVMGLLIFLPLAVHQERFAAELQLVILPALVLLCGAIMQSTAALKIGASRLPLRGLILSALILAQMAPAMVLQSGHNFDSPKHETAQSCDWSGAAAAVAQNTAPGAIVLAPLWYGPEIVWRSNRAVVAGPYEMAGAILDTAHFYDGSASRGIAMRRGISHVIVCAGDTDADFDAGLAKGKAPSWLIPEAFTGAPKGFRLYRVALKPGA